MATASRLARSDHAFSAACRSASIADFAAARSEFGFGPCVVEALRPHLFGFLLGDFQDRLALLRNAGARVFHLGEHRLRLRCAYRPLRRGSGGPRCGAAR